jgi:hypothetical protein
MAPGDTTNRVGVVLHFVKSNVTVNQFIIQ